MRLSRAPHHRACLLAGPLAILAACGGSEPAPPPPPPAAPVEAPAPAAPAEPPYAEVRAGWGRKLLKTSPAPGKGKPVSVGAGILQLRYPSPVGDLPGFLLLPSADGARMPVVVFAHAGYALDAATIDRCVPMVQAGFAVFVPTFRGQNGNPGSFEMFAGEVDDLAAAVAFVAKRREVDGKRVFVLGQGEGGQLAALLALREGTGVTATASIGALYRTEDLLFWRSIVPFDLNDPTEVRMRLLLPNLAALAVPHLAYVGADDEISAKNIPAFEKAARAVGAPLRVDTVKGDATSALGPAMARFVEAAKAGDLPTRRSTRP